MRHISSTIYSTIIAHTYYLYTLQDVLFTAENDLENTFCLYTLANGNFENRIRKRTAVYIIFTSRELAN